MESRVDLWVLPMVGPHQQQMQATAGLIYTSQAMTAHIAGS